MCWGAFPGVGGIVQINIEKLDSMEIVIKIQETCNINCTYCYMYNVGNEAYKEVPPRMSARTCEDIGRFVASEMKTREKLVVYLVLHGGEPLLMRPSEMRRRLETIRKQVEDAGIDNFEERVRFSLQTNAILVTEEWLDVISDWRIGVGVSVDGHLAMHDRRRVDKKGRGTYDRTIEGLKVFQADIGKRVQHLGALCVIDPNEDGGEVYRHLAHDLELGGFSFLLPFMNWDTYDKTIVEGVGRFLVSAYREWLRELANGKTRHVRIFKDALYAVKRGMARTDPSTVHFGHYVIVVESDGSVMTEESLRPTYSGLFSKLNIGQVSLDDIFGSPQHHAVIDDSHSVAEECHGCAIVSACRGGNALGRVGMKYDSKNAELRKSVYCDAFVALYIAIAASIQSAGGRYEQLNGFTEPPREALAT